ncbi:prohibitin family protein [Thermincola potens]|uniref:Band 7 protein n=1 Tax=Thermincola potens (strain JR) TaxID=635013 RepID=D5XA09_THEPJ|nr:prohibitin family protein [Thermincola potens]ADG83142.1 band 7 protein [Thermincola potens JR]
MENVTPVKTPGLPRIWTKIIVGVVALILFLGPLRPWYIVPPGHKGVVIQLGAVKGEFSEGIHFRIPLVQKIVDVNVQIQKSETESVAASKDLQMVTSKIALNYHVNPLAVAEVFQKIGLAYEQKIIDPAVQEAMKAITAKYTAEELITKRQQVALEIQQLLTTRLKKSDIVVDAFSIVNFQFSDEFNKAIEAKQTAEQLALKAQRDLQRVKIEAEQKVAAAKAEAEALKIQKEQVTADLIKLREIEVQKQAVEKWDGKLPYYNGGAVPFINIGR